MMMMVAGSVARWCDCLFVCLGEDEDFHGREGAHLRLDC